MEAEIRHRIRPTYGKDKVEIVTDDDCEIVIENNKCFVVRKQSKYPNTYEECCKVLGIQSDWHLTFELNNSASCDLRVNKEFEYVCKLETFRKLLICRDAYWKIAGEQIGLGKPWEPDWMSGLNKCCIIACENRIVKSSLATANAILAFPTEEMRDAFYENFKELIELVKELL